MSGTSRLHVLPAELRDLVYGQCESEVLCVSAHGHTRFYTSDSVKALRLSSQRIKHEVDRVTKPVRTLAVTTNISTIFAFSPVMGSINNSVPSHKLDTLVIPTGTSDLDSDFICPQLHWPSVYPPSVVRVFKDLTIIGVDHRVAISPDDPAVDYANSLHPLPENAAFTRSYTLASRIAGIAGARCTLYVNTDRKDWSGKVLTCAGSHTALIWQGVSASIPDFLPAFTLSTPIDHTFLLDVTDTLASDNYQTEPLVSGLTELSEGQYQTISMLGPAGQGSHVQIHLTVKSDDEQAVEALESCKTGLQGLGPSTKPEGCDGKVEIKVGRKHPAAPGGYRVKI